MYGVEPGHSDDRERPRGADRDHRRRPATASWRTRASSARRPGQQVRGAERRHDHPALQHLGHEGQADDRARPARGACVRPDSSARTREVRGRDEQQHEQRVGVVDARDRDRDRRQRQRRRRDQARGGAGDAADGREQQRDGGDRAQRLRQQHAEATRSRTRAPRGPSATATSGGLSTVMKLPGSIAPKNHAFQLSDAGARGRGVVLVRVAADRQVPEAQRRGEREHGDAARAGPSAGRGADRDGRGSGRRAIADISGSSQVERGAGRRWRSRANTHVRIAT